ncbi:MAG: hypothetical protein C0507_01555 [Cyanobacteria bacterium PR.3.49]|nr:hypothetical protein [Cyanobacteria bacterium PR.3.49]
MDGFFIAAHSGVFTHDIEAGVQFECNFLNVSTIKACARRLHALISKFETPHRQQHFGDSA